MTDSAELLSLRLALIAVIFVFVVVAGLTMRGGLRPATRSVLAGRPGPSPRFILLHPGQTGLPKGESFPVAGQMTIGRDPESGIILADPSVSSRHAALSRVADGWQLADLGSTNGTFINGQKVDGRPATLRGGEEVAIGIVVLRFQV